MEYLEKLRTSRMKSGHCALCGKHVDVLERHHESYRPEKTIDICHHCHHKLHFLPWELPDNHKEKLLKVRFGNEREITESMLNSYVAPGRRPAQLEVREKVKERSKL